MWKIPLLILVSIVWCIGWYGLVFWWNVNFQSDVRYAASLGEGVFLDSDSLSSSIVAFYANHDVSSADIISNCDITSEFLDTYKNLYFFRVDYSSANDCKNGNIVVSIDGEVYGKSVGQLELVSDYDLISRFIDYSSDDLRAIENTLKSKVEKNSIYKNYNGEDFIKYYSLLSGQRLYKEDLYTLRIVEKILTSREQKYISPVPGRTISETHSKVPNSGRPYRSAYTDGIHHGWDIDGNFGEDLVALDDGIIVRVVEDFENSDFSRIVYGQNLSPEQELKNLDILRGKQVWLKTMKGEVVFYSHLDSVDPKIEEWMIVQKWDRFGTMWVTGVPEEWYDDYHLHFAIMANPYDRDLVGTYDFWDYMAWDWLTRWLSHAEVVAAQKEIFE